jgi:4,5-DOPA dioxygenase extradiol
MPAPQAAPSVETPTSRMPTLFLSHGAPILADDAVWTAELAAWSQTIARPRAILMVSAHWEDAPVALSATEPVPLVYDFWGFPEHYYSVTYDAPGAPALADRVEHLLGAAGTGVSRDPSRGLDHGAYVPLVEMYPAADVPVLQMSLPTLDPTALHAIGRQLAPLRDEGVLIVGSGFATHNLSRITMAAGTGAPAPSWSSEFDHWLAEAADAQDVDALLDFAHRAPAAQLAHPRTEHFAPLFVTLGAGDTDLPTTRTVIDGFWFGLSKRSLQIG